MTQPNETPEQTIQRLSDELDAARGQLEVIEANHQEIIAEINNNFELAKNEVIRLQGIAARIPELEQRAGEANTLAMSLNDMTQERDRLRGLLLDCVARLDAFSPDYPQATIARTAFQGQTPEEVADKMMEWDATRAQKNSEWGSLVNYVRTQATV